MPLLALLLTVQLQKKDGYKLFALGRGRQHERRERNPTKQLTNFKRWLAFPLNVKGYKKVRL
jgi:uncharacterized protein YktB (UPF0637 family)